MSQTTLDDFGTGKMAQYHSLWPEIAKVCDDQLHHALKGVSDDVSGWQLFAEEGEMKMYRREEEIDGMVIDPLKSCHVVKGKLNMFLSMCLIFSNIASNRVYSKRDVPLFLRSSLQKRLGDNS